VSVWLICLYAQRKSRRGGEFIQINKRHAEELTGMNPVHISTIALYTAINVQCILQNKRKNIFTFQGKNKWRQLKEKASTL
jgi:hypothetical protein